MSHYRIDGLQGELSEFVRSVLKLDKAEDTVRMKCHTMNK